MVDSFYISLAINEAWKYQCLTYPNPAVGCVVTDANGAILAIEAHKKAGLPHAELEAARSALKKLNPLLSFPKDSNELHSFITQNHQNLLKNSTFYVTLEPCAHQGLTPPCASLIETLGVKKVVIGASDTHKIASGGADKLRKVGVEITNGVCQKECEELLEPFLLWQKKSFSFFKLALRLDGTYTGGIITTEKSREFVHKLRSVCDLIVVGGNTAREDRPTLDARLVHGKAPDALICTKKDIDRTIPLFAAPNREVLIQNHLDFPQKYKNIMVEGGSDFLKAMRDRVDWFLIFHSANFSENGAKTVELDLNLKLLYSGTIGSDRFGWYKRV